MRPPEQNAEKFKILVVDDNPNNIDVLVHALESRSYDLAIATSGERALKTTAHFHPDLILLDLMMPGMDGLETCRLLKSDPQTADIPVIIVTAAAAVDNSFAAGAVDYVVKPVREEEAWPVYAPTCNSDPSSAARRASSPNCKTHWTKSSSSAAFCPFAPPVKKSAMIRATGSRSSNISASTPKPISATVSARIAFNDFIQAISNRLLTVRGKPDALNSVFIF